GVPVGPIDVVLAALALLVLTMRERCTPHRGGEICRRGKRRLGGLDPIRQPCRDLLQQPAVPIRIAKRRKRAVRLVFRRRSADAVRAVGSELRARRPWVEHLADLDPTSVQFPACSLDIGDDQVQALRRARRGRGDLRPELNRTARSGRRELHDPEAVVEGEVRVEPPPEARVKLLRTLDLRNRDDDPPELQADTQPGHASAQAAALRLGSAHRTTSPDMTDPSRRGYSILAPRTTTALAEQPAEQPVFGRRVLEHQGSGWASAPCPTRGRSERRRRTRLSWRPPNTPPQSPAKTSRTA